LSELPQKNNNIETDDDEIDGRKVL
jgi:hypothetical protein